MMTDCDGCIVRYYGDEPSYVWCSQNRRIQRVIEMHFAHVPETAAIMGDPSLVGKCRVCKVPHPCPTVEALL